GPMGGGRGPRGPAIPLRVQSDLPTGHPRSLSGRHLPRPVRPCRRPVLLRRTRRGRRRSSEVLRTRTTLPAAEGETLCALVPRCPPDVRDARSLAPLDGGRDQGGDGHLDEERIVTGRDESLLPGPLSGPARIGEGASGRTVSRGPRKGLGGPTTHGGGAVRKLKIRLLR